MKEHDGKFGRIPIENKSEAEPLSISGFVRTDGVVTGYVLSNGLKITAEDRMRMEQSGELE